VCDGKWESRGVEWGVHCSLPFQDHTMHKVSMQAGCKPRHHGSAPAPAQLLTPCPRHRSVTRLALIHVVPPLHTPCTPLLLLLPMFLYFAHAHFICAHRQTSADI
jgi:hypothetical protein